MSNIKAYIPLAISLLGTVVSIVEPSVREFWANHPSFAGAVVAFMTAVNALLPSPLRK